MKEGEAKQTYFMSDLVIAEEREEATLMEVQYDCS
jgi:hypothetical protein